MTASLIRRELTALALAFGLLTRLPVPQGGAVDEQTLGRALHWYPVVGLVIGLILAAVAVFPLPNLLAAALIVALWAALTGALHLDGLADCADAWVGGMGDRERTLRILKDPACGPMGVTALVLALLLKTTAVATLLEAEGTVALALIPLLARVLLIPAFTATPYVRAGGMGQNLARDWCAEGLAIVVTLSLLLLSWWLPLPLLASWLLATGLLFAAWRRAMMHRLGGFTGDGAGALVELAETLLLLVSAVALGTVS